MPGDLPGGQDTECTSGASCGGERKSLLVWNKQYPCGPKWGREKYIHVPIHEYTKLLLINHSYTQSISLTEYPVLVKYEVGFVVSTGFPESLEGTLFEFEGVRKELRLLVERR